MATIYVSKAGSDSNNGTSVSTPLLTVGKANGNSSPVASTSDTTYIAPGVYSELLTLGMGGASGSPLQIIGDGDGAGFRAGGATSVQTGPVVIRGWSNSLTPLTTGETLVASNKSYVTIKNIKFIPGNGAAVYACYNITGTFSDWTFENCWFYPSATRQILGVFFSSAAQALNITFRRCRFLAQGNSSTTYGAEIRTPVASSEYGVNALFEGCLFVGSAGAVRVVNQGGTGSAWSTGVRLQHCTFVSCYRGLYVNAVNALTAPLQVRGCRFIATAFPIAATTSGQADSSGNSFEACGVNFSNASSGTGDLTSACPEFSLNDEDLFGGAARPCFEPSAGAAVLGAGNYGTPPAVDIRGRPRPASGQIAPSIGAMERGNVGTRDTTYQDSGSPACLAITGPNWVERPCLVKAGTRTISVKVRYDGNHGGANKPRLSLLPNPELGYAGEVKSATTSAGTGSTPNAYETITFAPFTIASDGVVVLRLESLAAATNGVAYFDTISIT